MSKGQPKPRKPKGGALRCMARGCRSVKTNDLRPHISRRLYARRAAELLPIRPAKAPANQTAAKASAHWPASSRHPSTEKPTCTVHTPQIQRPQSAASATDPPPSAHPPDLAVSVVARGHPTEASLQLLALEARLPFVARASLHKSKKGSSFRSWPPYPPPPLV